MCCIISIQVRLSRVSCEWFYLSLFTPEVLIQGTSRLGRQNGFIVEAQEIRFSLPQIRKPTPGNPWSSTDYMASRMWSLLKKTQALWSYQNQGIPAFPLTLLRHACGHLTKDTTDLLFWQIYILINFKVLWSYQTQGIPGCLQAIIWRHAVGRLSEPDMLLLLLLTLLLLLRMRQRQSTIFEAFVFLVSCRFQYH